MDGGGSTTTRLNPGISMAPGGALLGQSIQATPEATIHWDARNSTPEFTDAGGAVHDSFSFGYFGELLNPPGGGADVEPGLYATDMKADWDPVLGWELIGGDYATDIAQHYGSTHFEPGEHLAVEYDAHFVQWSSDSPWASGDQNITVKDDPKPPSLGPKPKEEECTHGCYGWAWGSKYVEWPGEWKQKWSCRQMDFVEACQNGKEAAKKLADKDCEYWDGPGCECKGQYGSAREFDWVKQRKGSGWVCYCKIVYRGDCVEK